MRKRKLISEIKGKKWQQINQREAKLINDGSVRGFLFFDAIVKSSGVTLSYDTQDLIPMPEFLKIYGMSKRLFVILLRNIVLALKDLEKNRFSKDLVIWSVEAVYVDPVSWHVYMMYVPLQPYENERNLKNFLLEFLECCIFDLKTDADYAQKLVLELNNKVSYSIAMLEEFCNSISKELCDERQKNTFSNRCPHCGSAIERDEDVCPFCGSRLNGSFFTDIKSGTVDNKVSSSEERTKLSVNEDERGNVTVFRSSKPKSSKMWIEEENSGNKIIVTQFPFRIGKMEGIVDYRIENSMVSRKHADILRDGEKYYIVDLDSSNGTYLNGKRILPGQKIEIVNDSNIRAANVCFKIHIE